MNGNIDAFIVATTLAKALIIEEEKDLMLKAFKQCLRCDINLSDSQYSVTIQEVLMKAQPAQGPFKILVVLFSHLILRALQDY